MKRREDGELTRLAAIYFMPGGGARASAGAVAAGGAVVYFTLYIAASHAFIQPALLPAL